jgi:hypothetical protein
MMIDLAAIAVTDWIARFGVIELAVRVSFEIFNDSNETRSYRLDSAFQFASP